MCRCCIIIPCCTYHACIADLGISAVIIMHPSIHPQVSNYLRIISQTDWDHSFFASSLPWWNWVCETSRYDGAQRDQEFAGHRPLQCRSGPLGGRHSFGNNESMFRTQCGKSWAFLMPVMIVEEHAGLWMICNVGCFLNGVCQKWNQSIKGLIR